MKKTACIIVLTFFMVWFLVGPASALTGVSVLRVVGGSAVKSGSNYIVPALVSVAAGTAQWLPLSVSITSLLPVIGAIVAGAVVTTGIQYMASRVFDGARGNVAYVNGQAGYNSTVYPFPPAFGGNPWPGVATVIMGYCANETAAQALVHTVHYDLNHQGIYTALNWDNQGKYCDHTYTQGGPPQYYTTHYVAFYGVTDPGGTSTFNAYDSTTAASMLDRAQTAGDPAVLPLINEVLSEIDKNLSGQSNTLAALRTTYQSILNNAVTQAQKDTVTALDPATVAAASATAAATAAATQQSVAPNLTAAQTQAAVQAGVDAALKANPSSGGGLTQAQTQAAVQAALDAQAKPNLTTGQVTASVKTALDDETGVSVPQESTTIIPDKLNLTTVMTTFMTSINSLPMLQTLRGLTINVGGSSSLCLNLPSNLGGTKCFDAAGMTEGLNTIGNIFLSLTTLFSFVSIFRG